MCEVGREKRFFARAASRSASRFEYWLPAAITISSARNVTRASLIASSGSLSPYASLRVRAPSLESLDECRQARPRTAKGGVVVRHPMP